MEIPALVHSDLKPANIFFHYNPDGKLIVKIGDLGAARWLGMDG